MKKRITCSVSLFFVIWNIVTGFAQPGTLDQNFNPSDQGFWKGNNFNGTVYASIIQADEKILLAGAFSRYNEARPKCLVRLNPDGTEDKTFNFSEGATGYIFNMVVQNDGKIIIVGTFQKINGVTRNRVARLNPDGSLDTAFDPGVSVGTSFSQTIKAVHLLKDGKIIIGGSFTSFNGKPIKNLVRLNSNGSLDTTFQVGTGITGSVSCIREQDDGKIVVGGSMTEYNGTAVTNLIRLNADGYLDNTYNTGTGPAGTVQTSYLLSDGRLLIAGSFNKYNGVPTSSVARIQTNGAIDTTFGPGVIPNEEIAIEAMHIGPNGKIVIGGRFATYHGASVHNVARLNSDGSFDNSFKQDIGPNGVVYTLVIQKTDILVGGDFYMYETSFRNNIARIHGDGSLDKTIFDVTGNGLNGYLWTTTIQPDGKILAGGLFKSYNGKLGANITRINRDGSVDPTFNPGHETDDWVEAIQPLNDGKILVAGYFKKFNGVTTYGLIRLNADGSLDNTWKYGDKEMQLEAILLEPDGKIIIGGYIEEYNKVKVNGIARLFPDGSVDSTFLPSKNMDAGSDLFKLVRQPDGKIIVAGFLSYAGTTAQNIIRLNADGTLDKSFNPGTGTNTGILAVGLQQDGKIIIGGVFTSFNGKPVNRIARLNADGSLDPTYQIGSGTDSYINTISVQENGKAIIGGGLKTYNGTKVNYICRLNTDGTVDSVFKSGNGTDFPVYTTTLQNDGKIIIGGNFTNYNGTGRNGIARIIGDKASGIDAVDNDSDVVIYPNPSTGRLIIEGKGMEKINVYDVLGRTISQQKCNNQQEILNLSKETNGVYLIEVVKKSQHIIKRVVIDK